MGNIDSLLCVGIFGDLESERRIEMGKKFVAQTARNEASRVIEVGVCYTR